MLASKRTYYINNNSLSERLLQVWSDSSSMPSKSPASVDTATTVDIDYDDVDTEIGRHYNRIQEDHSQLEPLSLDDEDDDETIAFTVNAKKEHTITIRPIQLNDKDAVKALHETWFPVKYQDEFYDELVVGRMAHSHEPLFTRVAVSDCSSIVATVVGAMIPCDKINKTLVEKLVNNPQRHDKLFYIMTLGTVQEYRQYGLGTRMIQLCMEQVEQEPACGVLYLHVIVHNYAAIRFYERLGFVRVQEIPNYYSIDNKLYSCYLYAKYYNGNLGTMAGIYTVVKSAVSSWWKNIQQKLYFWKDDVLPLSAAVATAESSKRRLLLPQQ